MKEPLAIRSNHQPFFIFPLAFLRWTDYRCPHCHTVFRRDFWPDNIRLGSGERTCNGCAKVFDDGSREWPELKFGRKLRFLLPPGIQVMTASFLLFSIGALCVAPIDVVNWRIEVLLIGGSLLPTMVWLLIRFLPVHNSSFRYDHDPSSMRKRIAETRNY
jgi:hypothetical protein